MGNSLPNQSYKVFKSRPLTTEGKDALIYLYQPIIESDALALYLTLASDVQAQSFSGEESMTTVHLDILNAMNAGMPRFIKAKQNLEGIGLLKSYEKADAQNGSSYLYWLQEPVHPAAFFQDELYAYLLLERVGERKFDQLVKLYQPKQCSLTDYQEVTQSFSAAYGLNTARFASHEETLQAVSDSFQETNANLVLDENQLDWDFLLYEAQRRYIRAANFTPSFRQKLVLYHSLYGYDVLELLDLMADNVSLTTGEVDQKKLELAIMKKSRQTFTKTSKREDPQAESQLRRFNTLKQNGFSENDVLLIQESENNAPIAFLKAIKAEKNSFMTDSEQWLIKSLVERSPLPNSVINVLVHYVLVVQNNAALSGNYVNNIAAQWSELKIGTAEDAIKHVRSLVRSAKEKRSRPQTSGKKIIREEKLPSWAEKPVEETALTPERQAELDKKLQNYLHKKAGDK